MSQTCDVFVHDSHVPWFRSGAKSVLTVCGRGYAFADGQFFSGQSLINELQSRLCRYSAENGIAIAREIIAALNGCWAVVVQWPDGRTLAAVDRLRSIPLLYGRTANGYVVTNTVDGLAARTGDLTIASVCALEFLLSGHTSGQQTLFTAVSQVQPGEMILLDPTWNPTAVTHVRYFTCFPERARDATRVELMGELEQVFESMFRRCARAMEGKTPIIPLSGGFDSRAIACMLRRSGVEQALCYTYGVKDHWEVDVARRIAGELGFGWRFVEYDPALWHGSMASPEMHDYWRYAYCGTSLPVLHTYPALVALRQTGDLKERAVFLPGDLGDAWGGLFCLSSLRDNVDRPPGECASPYRRIRHNDVVSAVVYRHLNLWPTRGSSWHVGDLARVLEKIEAELRACGSYGLDDVVNYMEWVIRNRSALWIVNRQRAFEYFGGDFYLPFGDHEFIDFFRALPPSLLRAKQFYHEFLTEHVFPTNIRQIPCSAGRRQMGRVKHRLRDCLELLRLTRCIECARRPSRGIRGVAADTWFTQGRAPWNVTVGEALSPYAISKHLPESLLETVTPLLARPSYAIPCYGLFAAAFLATVYAEVGQSRQGSLGIVD